VSWLADLERELRSARVPARRRRRIMAELSDHLACDPSAEERLGESQALARQFADEVGTSLARQAAFATFLALVPLGVLFVALFALTAVYTTNVEPGVTLALVVGVQFAFVGGMLTLLRAWRLRQAAVIPAAEARVLLRRAALGLAGGAVTVGALLFVAPGRWLGVEWSLPALAWATVGVGAASIVFGSVALARAMRLLPVNDGEPRDLSFDLGVAAGPWRLALTIAGVIVLCIAAAGVVQADPIDGLVRAIGDGVLCLAGFAVLGRPLGLRA
jgi:hypothetical protein